MDSNNTAMVFADEESIVKKKKIIIKKLLAPRPLYFIDSILTLLITNYFTTWMLIGPYTKVILFLITKLLPITLIILGMFWL